MEPTSTTHLGVRILVGVQLFVAADYLLTTVVPYLLYYGIPGKPIGGPHDDVWIIDTLGSGGAANLLGWLFVLPGFYITVFGAPISAMLTLLGLATAALRWSDVSVRTRAFLVVGTVLCAMFFVLTLTSLGQDLAVWIAD
jgi:hypothetical protein